MIFYSQNDPRWNKKEDKLGQSSCSIAQFGCTTTDIAMGGTWFEEIFTPKQLSQSLEYTKDGKILWQSIGKVFKRMKFFWRFYKHDERLIMDALKNPNKVVLLNVDRGYHWVFALSKIPLFGYRCVDPYPYPHRVRYYKPSEVEGGAVLIRK